MKRRDRMLSAVVMLALTLFVFVLTLTVPPAHATGLSIDSHGIDASPCPTSTCTISLSTSDANDIVVVFFQSNPGATLTSINDGDSLSWHPRAAFGAVGGRDQAEWWALAPGALSSDTVTLQISANSNGRLAFIAINGADTSSPYDTNAAEPAIVNGNSPASCSMTTSDANDILFGEAGQGGTGYSSSPAGWALLDKTTYGFQSATAYRIVSSTVSSQTETWTFNAGSNISGLCDAIQVAAAPVPEFPSPLTMAIVFTVAAGLYVLVRSKRGWSRGTPSAPVGSLGVNLECRPTLGQKRLGAWMSVPLAL